VSLRLITIPISHFCEKARWALERAGLLYVEDAHLQVFHYLATLRRCAGFTVPVLVHAGGVINESSDILHWVDAAHPSKNPLFPRAVRSEVEELVRELDRDLGPSGRLWMYAQLLPYRELLERYGCTGVPQWQRRAVPLTFPLIGQMLSRGLGITEQSEADALIEVTRIFDGVAERLGDGRQFLVGDAFSAADLTFASLSAPLLLPRNYGVPLPDVDELPHGCAEQIRHWRQHPAGKFALRMFEQERNRRV